MAAWGMLGGGAALIIVGALIPEGEATGEYVPNPFTIISEEHENDGVKGAFVAVGMISMLGSIPFFIASGKNKRKAASLSFITMRTPQIKNSSMVYKAIPAVSLKVTL